MGQDQVTSEVDDQLKNIELRTMLEPYYDESIGRLSFSRLKSENSYLEAVYEWETTQAKPIAEWFEPVLCPPAPDKLNDRDLSDILDHMIVKFRDKRIRLKFADHLSNRELYTVIWRNILPQREKEIQSYEGERVWDCAHINGDPLVWLHYYASDEERQVWEEFSGEELPPAEDPKYIRNI